MCDQKDQTPPGAGGGHSHHHGRILGHPLSADATRRQILRMLGLSPALMIMSKAPDAWALADSRVDMRIENGQRIITSNGIPDHPTGQFPNRGNPHSITSQNHRFTMPASPVRRGPPQPYDHSSFGVAINGVPFDPFTAEYWQRDRRSNWRYEALSGKVDLGLDDYNAHVQPDGSYHYHGVPLKLVRRWSPQAHSPLIGYAADGFPIYILFGYHNPSGGGSGVRPLRASYRIKSGTRPDGPGGQYDGTFVADYEYVPGLGDLDEANGRETVTPEYPRGTYAYFLTDAFPFIPRYFAGTPDRSFMKGPGGPGGQSGNRQGGMQGGPGGGQGNGQGSGRGFPPGGGRPGPFGGPPPHGGPGGRPRPPWE